MADEEQVKRLLDGAEGWNEWREENPGLEIDFYLADLRGVNLSGTNLSGAKLFLANLIGANLKGAQLIGANLKGANFSHADLSGASFSRAKLKRANLSHADLSEAKLGGADLFGANLSHADLRDAHLRGANLYCTDLIGANLSGTQLYYAELRDADLRDANLTNVRLGRTTFAFCNLSDTKGLETAEYLYPSTIGADTLELTAQGLAKNPTSRGSVETFLRAAGVPESIMEVFALMIENPIEFYSCFISYSHDDKAFARRVYDALQGRGIRCWLDEHQIRGGDDIYDMVDRGIRLWDKTLLLCSEYSLTSWWVNDEIDKALEKERKLWEERSERVHAIVPLNLDGYLFDGWQDGRSATLRKRFVIDFNGWESDNQIFEDQFEKVVLALKTTRPKAPIPKL